MSKNIKEEKEILQEKFKKANKEVLKKQRKEENKQKRIQEFKDKILGTLNDNEELYFKVLENCPKTEKSHNYKVGISDYDGSLFIECSDCQCEFWFIPPNYSGSYPFNQIQPVNNITISELTDGKYIKYEKLTIKGSKYIIFYNDLTGDIKITAMGYTLNHHWNFGIFNGYTFESRLKEVILNNEYWHECPQYNDQIILGHFLSQILKKKGE